MNTTTERSYRFLDLLEPPERDALFALGRRLRAPAGATLMLEGESGDRVMVLLSGLVKVTRVSGDGRETLLALRDPGDLLGEVAFIDGGARTSTVTAVEAVEVLMIPASVLHAHIERAPRVATAMLEVTVKRFRDLTQWRSRLARLDTLGRLAARLIELADRYGSEIEQGVEIAVGLTQEDLTCWTDASRAGVASALRTFRELGWIETRRRQLIVREPEALRQRAD